MQYDEKYHIPVNARAAGVVLIDEQSRILLVQEKLSSKSGLWHIPSGSVEPGEPLEQTAKRETKEETGLDVSLVVYLNTNFGRFDDGDFVARHVWIARPVGDQPMAPKLSEEIETCRYFSKQEFEVLYTQGKIRMYHTKLIFEDALALLKTQAT